MLSFDIRSLESKAVQVDDDLAADDPVWAGDDTRPLDGVHVEGRLSAAGEERFYFSGSLSGVVKLDCRRCLADVTTDVSGEVHFLFAPAGDETAADDPDVFTYDAGARELDLRPAVREAWLLEAPSLVLCRPDCKGLCPSCGTDLNTDQCECGAAKNDSRWEALRHARDESHS